MSDSATRGMPLLQRSGSLFLSDGSGRHWVYAIPAALAFLTIVDSLQSSWSVSNGSSIISIGWGPYYPTLVHWVILVLTVTYLVFPTPIGWALFLVPAVSLAIVRVFHIRPEAILSWLGVEALVIGFCVAVVLYRPRSARGVTAISACMIALVLQAWLVTMLIWNR
jgi:hypothetical protein